MKEEIRHLLADARSRCVAHRENKFCTYYEPIEECPYAKYGRDCYIALQADHLAENGAVVRRKGEWIPQNAGRTRFMCSNCKSENHPGGHLFCCVCGADMRGEHESD